MPSAYPAAIGRRLITIPASWALFGVAILLAPLAVIAAMATDLGLRRTGWPTIRMVAFVLAALWIETSGQVRTLWSWVTQPFVRMNWTKRNQQLMRWWARRLVGAAERVVGVRWRFDVPDDLGPGPLLAFAQHVSIVDAIAPVYILANRTGWYLRYTMTRGLRFDPCLDIVGHRMAIHFVARGGGDNAQELAHLRTLVTDMDGDECAAIFPGGGLFTAAGLERAVEKLTERGSPQAGAATAYRHVLPPRPGGVTAFFQGAPQANVVIVGHVGFEPLASIRKLWSVLPLTEPVDVKVWRYDRGEVPVGEDERMAWLYDKWRIMDDWIDEQLRVRAAEEAVPA